MEWNVFQGLECYSQYYLVTGSLCSRGLFLLWASTVVLKVVLEPRVVSQVSKAPVTVLLKMKFHDLLMK